MLSIKPIVLLLAGFMQFSLSAALAFPYCDDIDIRLRDGSFELANPSAQNLPIYSIHEDLTFGLRFRNKHYSGNLQIYISDSDGGIIYRDVVELTNGEFSFVKLPTDYVFKLVGEPLSLSVLCDSKYLNRKTELRVLFGVLNFDNAAYESPRFGVVCSPACATPRGNLMLRVLGVDWIRHRAIRWNIQNDLEASAVKTEKFVQQWDVFRNQGFHILAQTFAHSAPPYAVDKSLAHRNRVSHIKPIPFGNWVSKVAYELPQFVYFKLLNERDRDPRLNYLESYAVTMKRGYAELKSKRPDSVVAVEGGYTVDIVNKLIGFGLYENLDVIDHHLYGDTNIIRDFRKRVTTTRENGYMQPIISSEFGVVPGSGGVGFSYREASVQLVKNVSYFFASGGSRFFYFIYSTLGVKITKLFSGVFLVDDEGDQPRPVYFSYSLLSRLFSGDSSVELLSDNENITHISFKGDFEEGHVFWSRNGRGELEIMSKHPVTVFDSFGRKYILDANEGGMILNFRNEPIILMKNEGLVLRPRVTKMAECEYSIISSKVYKYSLDCIHLSGDRVITPLPPRGWDVKRLDKNIWEVVAPNEIADGVYSMRLRVVDKRNKILVYSFDTIEYFK